MCSFITFLILLSRYASSGHFCVVIVLIAIFECDLSRSTFANKMHVDCNFSKGCCTHTHAHLTNYLSFVLSSHLALMVKLIGVKLAIGK